MNAKKIDVLAVMDRARRTISAQSKLSDDVMAHLAEDVKQARDAVAELMESSKDAGWLLAHLGKMTSLPEVTAAIERDLPPLLSAISRLDHAAQTKCNCPGEGKSNPSSHAPNCPVRATQPAQASEADDAERLRVALEDLLSWFPEKPAPAEWRLTAGNHGADAAIEAARAAIATSSQETASE